MKCLILLAFSLAFIGLSEGQVARALEKENPDYPGKCVFEAQNGDVTVIDDGKSITSPDECVEIGCSVGFGEFTLDYTGCGKVAAPPGCQVVRNNALPYPGCCRVQFKC